MFQHLVLILVLTWQILGWTILTAWLLGIFPITESICCGLAPLPNPSASEGQPSWVQYTLILVFGLPFHRWVSALCLSSYWSSFPSPNHLPLHSGICLFLGQSIATSLLCSGVTLVPYLLGSSLLHSSSSITYCTGTDCILLAALKSWANSMCGIK